MDLRLTLLVASGAAFGLALLSAVAGFGGGALLLPVFTALFGLRVAVPPPSSSHCAWPSSTRRS